LFFDLLSLRFSFVAIQSIHFAAGKPSNILRGAFGVIFRRLACVPQCQSAQTCEWRATCPYARLFCPTATTPGPSGLADWPRPFVFRATHLDDQTFAPGESFHFDLNLFDTASPALAYLALTFTKLAREGLGAGRRKVELTSVTPRPITLDLSSQPEKISQLTVRFLTPTELKGGQQLAILPDFEILAARARDRISTLRELYGPGPVEIDFKAYANRAAQVQMTRCEIKRVKNQRHSTRTGQIHPLGGFVGEADYEGDLSGFVPYLKAAQWTGVGRQTSWGKGQIAVEVSR
jgi:hypothetical protein